jgi:hypothetical protein
MMNVWAMVTVLAVMCFNAAVSTGSIDGSVVEINTKSKGVYGFVEVRSGAHMFW